MGRFDQLRNKAEDLAKKAKPRAEELKEKAGPLAHSLKEKAEQAAGTAKAKVDELRANKAGSTEPEPAVDEAAKPEGSGENPGGSTPSAS